MAVPPRAAEGDAGFLLGEGCVDGGDVELEERDATPSLPFAGGDAELEERDASRSLPIAGGDAEREVGDAARSIFAVGAAVSSSDSI